DGHVTGVQTCALPISKDAMHNRRTWLIMVAAFVAPAAAADVPLRGDEPRAQPSLGLASRWTWTMSLAPSKSRLRSSVSADFGDEIGRASCRERVWSSG